MSSLYLYFFKQYKNTWKNLSLRLKIEIVILFIIYFTFFTTRLINIFNEQLSNSNTTSFGLSQFILHILILLISFSVPFIHLNLLPKQKGMVHYRTLPLNKLNTFWLVYFLHFKYQLIGFIVIFPIFIALMAALGVIFSVYFFVCVLLYQILLVLFISVLAVNTSSNSTVLLKYFMPVLIVFAIYFVMYFYTDYYFLFDPVLLSGTIIFLTYRWKNYWYAWDSYIQRKNTDSTQRKIKDRLFCYSDLKKLPFRKISPLFAKEMLNYIRNRKFIRLQFILFSIFCSILLIMYFKVQDDFVLYSSILTVLVIWQHFSLQFNEKYVKADSAFFMKTLPFKYYQLWLAKLINEFLFVFILLICLTVLYFIKGSANTEIFQSLLVILIFSLIVLATIINFKIIFFDRPRFAGYAYHFFIVFIAVMSINYYLVGPIITLFLLFYFTVYSYREFVR